MPLQPLPLLCYLSDFRKRDRDLCRNASKTQTRILEKPPVKRVANDLDGDELTYSYLVESNNELK